MTNIVLIKRSATANAVPTGGQLANGEIAINYADGNLFFKDSGGSVQTLASKKFVSVTGNIAGGNVETGIVSATGNVIAGNLNAGGLSLSSNVVSALVSAANITTTANIAGGYFIGNGSQLTGLPASYSDANVATFLSNFGSNTVSTTGNVTTGNLTVNGNITYVNSNVVTINDKFINVANNAATSGAANGGGLGVGPVDAEYATLIFNNGTTAWNTNIPLSVNGNVTGSYFVGNGSALTSVTGANVTGNVANATYAVSAGSAGSAVTAEQVTFAVQANITGVGTLGNLSVSGNTTVGNLSTGGFVSATGNVTGNVFIGNGSQLTGITSSYGNANVVANLAALGSNPVSTTGNITGGNINGNGSGLSSVTGANVTGTVANATYATSAGTATSATTAGTVTSNAQANITSVGILSSLSASGNITGGNVTAVSLLKTTDFSITGNVTSNLLPSANITYDLGSNTQRWKDLYLSGNTIQLGSQTISANATSVSLGADAELAANNVFATNQVSGATVSASGNIVAGGSGSSGQISATGNITGGNLITGAAVSAVSVSASGNVTGGNVNVGNIIIATDLISSANATITIDPATVGNAGLVVINGNLQVNGTTTTINSNVVSTNDLTVNYANNAINAAAANGGGIEIGPIGSPFITWLYNNSANVFTSSGGISAVGNVIGGNLNAAGMSLSSNVVSALNVTGAIAGANLTTPGLISATGNITGGNVNAAGLSLSSNVISEINSSANITTTANIAGSYFIGNGSQLTGIAGGGNYSNANVATFLADFGSNVISATGNVTGGNVISGGVRVYKWTTQANTAPSNSVPGDNWYDSYADKLYLYINDGVGNQWVDQSSPTTFASLNILGNTASGNLSTLGQMSAAGNVTGNYFLGNGSQLTGIDATSIQNGTSNVRVVSSGGNITVGVGGTANVVQFANTGAFVTGVVSAAGNVTAGNLITSAAVSATSVSASGNVTGANVNATTLSATGNVQSGNLRTTGLISATGNVTGGNILTAGLISATGNGVIAGRDLMVGGTFNSYTSAGRGTIVINGTSDVLLELAISNISSGYLYQTTTSMSLINLRGGNLQLSTNGTSWNILNTGILSGTGNVQGGNLRTTGLISATGNVTGGNILGGANVNATTHTGTTVSVSGNITGGNLIISGSISDSAQLDINTTSANANIVLTPNGTGNVNTPANVSVTGNIQSGNLRTAGLISATGNVTGGNILGVPVATNGIVVNSLTVATSYTIATGYSGTSAGPITISGGVVVTVSPGSRWVII